MYLPYKQPHLSSSTPNIYHLYNYPTKRVFVECEFGLHDLIPNFATS